MELLLGGVGSGQETFTPFEETKPRGILIYQEDIRANRARYQKKACERLRRGRPTMKSGGENKESGEKTRSAMSSFVLEEGAKEGRKLQCWRVFA